MFRQNDIYESIVGLYWNLLHKLALKCECDPTCLARLFRKEAIVEARPHAKATTVSVKGYARHSYEIDLFWIKKDAVFFRNGKDSIGIRYKILQPLETNCLHRSFPGNEWNAHNLPIAKSLQKKCIELHLLWHSCIGKNRLCLLIGLLCEQLLDDFLRGFPSSLYRKGSPCGQGRLS